MEFVDESKRYDGEAITRWSINVSSLGAKKCEYAGNDIYPCKAIMAIDFWLQKQGLCACVMNTTRYSGATPYMNPNSHKCVTCLVVRLASYGFYGGIRCRMAREGKTIVRNAIAKRLKIEGFQDGQTMQHTETGAEWI